MLECVDELTISLIDSVCHCRRHRPCLGRDHYRCRRWGGIHLIAL